MDRTELKKQADALSAAIYESSLAEVTGRCMAEWAIAKQFHFQAPWGSPPIGNLREPQASLNQTQQWVQEHPTKVEDCYQGPESAHEIIYRKEYLPVAWYLPTDGDLPITCPDCARYEERVGPGERCLEHQAAQMRYEDGTVPSEVAQRHLVRPVSRVTVMADTPMHLEPHERAARRFQIVAASYRKGRGMAR